MNRLRLLMRWILGRRLARTSGECRVPGPTAPIRIRRDSFGVPVIDAQSDADAWFGLGFCQGQDRPAQLEALLRLSRGTMAELVGVAGLPLDRICRRIGFRRSAEAQWPLTAERHRAKISSFVAGLNAGMTRGLPRRSHEFVILGATPTPWEPVDILGLLKLQSFLLASNWDIELARLMVLRRDGIDALRALDPAYPSWQHVTIPPGETAGVAIDRLAEDLDQFRGLVPTGGGSNNWVLAGSKTATGRPIVANDPHLAPLLPTHWYLAHVRAPSWSLCGGVFVGSPAFSTGHNGHAAWGVTAGLIDNTDLFLEEIGPDGRSVRQGDEFVPCEVRTEQINVKKSKPVIEEVLVTPRGPIVSAAFDGVTEAVSMRAVWLDPAPVDGWFDAQHAKSFDEFRQAFARWPGLPQNLVYADVTGEIGLILTGDAPIRKRGWGTVPLPGWDSANGWKSDRVPYDQMPSIRNPKTGFACSANNRPKPEGEGPFLGADFLDGYRQSMITRELASRNGWTVEECLRFQTDQRSLPWEELRPILLSLPTTDADAQVALDLLCAWDGIMAADSPAASVFELFLAGMSKRLGKVKAPKSYEWAIGRGFVPMAPDNYFCHRRVAHLVKLLREQPAGWFPGGWPPQITEALGDAVRDLRRDLGSGTEDWAWGKVRPARLLHLLFHPVRLLRSIFDIGPFPHGGDGNTVNQASTPPLKPRHPPETVPVLRAVFDVGDWSRSRFILAGGQSGNVCSPHYADMVPLWRRGEAIAIPWTDAEIDTATKEELVLVGTSDV